MKNRILSLFIALIFISCNDDFLEKPPLDQAADETYWSNENNVRTFAYGFYTDYFTGFGSGYTMGRYWTGNNQNISDDVAPSTPAPYTPAAVPSTGGGYTFANVRKANIFIDRVSKMTSMSDEAKNHWIGIGRFFRGLEYHDLVRRFGDVPYYDKELTASDKESLFKKRDSRTYVMDQVLVDFRFAAENVRVLDNAAPKLQHVNRNVVLAFMSRVFLFEGTWQKYHLNNEAKAKEYLEAAKWAAEQVINTGSYSLGNYRAVFSSLDLSANPEVLMFRQYASGVVQHSVMSYNNKESQAGGSRDLIESYLATDGLPIGQSPLYKGDKGIENVISNRDPRLTETFVPQIRLQGMTYGPYPNTDSKGASVYNFSPSGYVAHKFLNESTKSDPNGNNNLNETDAPIIRYGEVLINYAEAAAELATLGGSALTQRDLDISINELRKRPGIKVAPLQISGDLPASNGVIINDPKRDSTVPAMIWEIRRERRVELVFEGFRFDDLRRWKKLEYTDTETNFTINRGAWVSRNVKDEYRITDEIRLAVDGGAPSNTLAEGYVVPSYNAAGMRRFTEAKYYLFPLPLDQLNLFKDAGYGDNIYQNPGWM